MQSEKTQVLGKFCGASPQASALFLTAPPRRRAPPGPRSSLRGSSSCPQTLAAHYTLPSQQAARRVLSPSTRPGVRARQTRKGPVSDRDGAGGGLSRRSRPCGSSNVRKTDWMSGGAGGASQPPELGGLRSEVVFQSPGPSLQLRPSSLKPRAGTSCGESAGPAVQPLTLLASVRYFRRPEPAGRWGHSFKPLLCVHRTLCGRECRAGQGGFQV